MNNDPIQQYHLRNRPDREITDVAEITDLLKNGKYSVISMCRENVPYIVTLSYGYDIENNALYFHCSPIGLKLDFIITNSLVCATVIEDGGYINNECGHNYRTVVFWGKMTIVDDLPEKIHGAKVLLDHLEQDAEVKNEKLERINKSISGMTILKLEIKRIHGKAGR